VGVEAERARRDRAQEVLPVLHLDQVAGGGLEIVVEDRRFEQDLGVDALAAALLEVDGRRLLVHAVVAREADAGNSRARLDQLVDRPVAGDGRHVHAHGIAGVEPETEEDRGAEGVGADLQEPQVPARRFGQPLEVVLVVMDPLQELLRLDDAGGAEDGRPGHPHVLDPHHRAAGLADRRATPVGAGHEGGLGRGHGDVDLLVVHVLAPHAQRPHDPHRDLGDADEVLAVPMGGALDVQRVVADVRQRGPRHLLERVPADLRGLLGGEVLGQLVEPALSLDQRADEVFTRQGGGGGS
jgi:hypothetical protein